MTYAKAKLTDAYLAELSATFNELMHDFAELHQRRPGGDQETRAGEIAMNFLATLAVATGADELTTAKLWSALSAERGSVGACATLGNLARAVRVQLLENETSPAKAK